MMMRTQRATVEYIAPLLSQLAQMAERDGLPELAYLLAMARQEAADLAERFADADDSME
ncbi:hypothetical protein [Oharaeibacter diazotrophicus]|uniref:Uncharacterized protein n=2 Tax=Oharaeibacter diazotrophicus TaxID=1920512 RepID=A0A4R6RHP1_9HYPH|nr:hypothetical protein [Oharaeibacter diazotrophicus]TDP85357.1 hypothetical protein EDD54_2210 [Oharaeibacter diazotrophicus]BBE74327.1 hypothetical protein OHA_1_03958 [Pleomorphomonas sp. SM30]